MWTEVINLIRIETEEEEDSKFFAGLLDLNDWLRRQYGPKGTTIEEVRLAYNCLVMEELYKDDGRVLVNYRKLDTHHLGEVLAAYARFVEGTTDVNRVITNGLYLPAPAEPTPDNIDAMMEYRLKEAIEVTKRNINYYDLGNGLYTWLFNKGRIRPAPQEWEEALILAQARVRESLALQMERVNRLSSGFRMHKKDGVDGFQPLREVLKQRLTNVINGEGDFKKRVRQEAFRICMTNWLTRKAGLTEAPAYHLPTTPNLPPPDNGAQKPFSHREYIDALKEQLPTMGDEQVSDLQRKARDRNVLDVYELTTEEWQKRQAAKPPPKTKPKKR